MIKTQVQVPDHLYDEAKRIAHDYEMSLAEVFRRALERLAPFYPPRQAASAPTEWQLPTPRRLGAKALTSVQLRDIAREEEGAGLVPED